MSWRGGGLRLAEPPKDPGDAIFGRVVIGDDRGGRSDARIKPRRIAVKYAKRVRSYLAISGVC